MTLEQNKKKPRVKVRERGNATNMRGRKKTSTKGGT